ncbi:MAG TPA: PAS domain S-box protein, partial [Thermodesulfovibrionales bacterium]|nr:PAS domain S-box protein [Thermodesulfovibrionales bacterium]
ENLQLRESHKALIESARDVIYTLSPGGLVTSLNPAFETITGWSRADWIGKPFSSILHPDDLSTALTAFHGALRGEVSPTLELRVRARSGGYLVGEFIMPPLIADGKVVGISGVARDITERKRAEEKLRELMDELSAQKEFSEAIYNHTPSGIMVLDREGHVLKINHPGAEILKISPIEALGMPLISIYPETKEMLTLDPHYGREILITLPDGKTRPVGFTNSPLLDKNGTEKGIIIVFRDLTEVKELKAELRKKQHFEAMGKVISGVAHEIRNPLFGIQAIAQILKRESESPQHQALISALLKETQRMRNLVDELLLYSRPSALNLIEMDLDIFLAELKEFFKTKHPEKILLVNVPSLTHFKADKDKLMQVFMNLLENASGAGSTQIDITSEKKHGGLRITVKDDGAGITADALERIFEPFYTTKKEGTGLGLPICRKIMEAHGGSIGVESIVGTGTTFILSFKEQ